MRMDTSRVKSLSIERLWEIYKFYVLGLDCPEEVAKEVDAYIGRNKDDLLNDRVGAMPSKVPEPEKPEDPVEEDYRKELLNTLKEQNKKYDDFLKALNLRGTATKAGSVPPPAVLSASAAPSGKAPPTPLEVLKLRQKAETARKEAEAAKKEAEEKEQEIQKAEQKKIKHKSRAAAEKAKAEQEQKARERTEKELTREKERAKKLVDELSNAQKKAIMVQDASKNHESEASKLKHESAMLQARHDALNAEHQQTREHLDRVQTELTGAKRELIKLTNDLSTQHTKVRSDTNQQIEQLKRDHVHRTQQLEAAIHQHQQAHEQAQTEINDLRTARAQLADANRELESQFRAAQQEARVQQEHYKQLSLKDEFNATAHELLQNETDQLRNEVNTLKTMLEKQRSKEKEISEREKKALKKVTKLQQKLSDFQQHATREIEKGSSFAFEIGAERDQLRLELQNAAEELARLGEENVANKAALEKETKRLRQLEWDKQKSESHRDQEIAHLKLQIHEQKEQITATVSHAKEIVTKAEKEATQWKASANEAASLAAQKAQAEKLSMQAEAEKTIEAYKAAANEKLSEMERAVLQLQTARQRDVAFGQEVLAAQFKQIQDPVVRSIVNHLSKPNVQFDVAQNYEEGDVFAKLSPSAKGFLIQQRMLNNLQKRPTSTMVDTFAFHHGGPESAEVFFRLPFHDQTRLYNAVLPYMADVVADTENGEFPKEYDWTEFFTTVAHNISLPEDQMNYIRNHLRSRLIGAAIGFNQILALTRGNIQANPTALPSADFAEALLIEYGVALGPATDNGETLRLYSPLLTQIHQEITELQPGREQEFQAAQSKKLTRSGTTLLARKTGRELTREQPQMQMEGMEIDLPLTPPLPEEPGAFSPTGTVLLPELTAEEKKARPPGTVLIGGPKASKAESPSAAQTMLLPDETIMLPPEVEMGDLPAEEGKRKLQEGFIPRTRTKRDQFVLSTQVGKEAAAHIANKWQEYIKRGYDYKTIRRVFKDWLDDQKKQNPKIVPTQDKTHATRYLLHRYFDFLE